MMMMMSTVMMIMHCEDDVIMMKLHCDDDDNDSLVFLNLKLIRSKHLRVDIRLLHFTTQVYKNS